MADLASEASFEASGQPDAARRRCPECTVEGGAGGAA